MITITLSKKEPNTSSIGYQPPQPPEQVKPSTQLDYDGEGSPNGPCRGWGGRGRSRGRGNGFVPAEYEDGVWDRNIRGYPRGQWRGGSFHGWGKGGYIGHKYYHAKQDGGYNYEAPPQGSGRDRGPNYYDAKQDGGYNYEEPPQGNGRAFPPCCRGRGRGNRGRGRGNRANELIQAAARETGWISFERVVMQMECLLIHFMNNFPFPHSSFNFLVPSNQCLALGY